MITFTQITSIVGIGFLGYAIGRIIEKILIGKRIKKND